MNDSPVSGPSRLPRPDPTNLADRIIALQRRNAALSTRPRTVLTRKLVVQVDEFSRGAEIAPVQKTLFDPARPIPLVQPRSDTEDRPRRPRADPPIRRTEAPVKRLFNPAIHDPHSFHPRPVEPARQDSGSSSRSLLRPAPNGRTPEEEADRERERRKRREGSERGSHASKRKDVDAKSKGSRSSEGSESLKDRERGKAKGDTGIKLILRDLHSKIRILEQELTEMHHKMALDPEAGISVLLDRPANPYSREIRATDNDAAAWMDLIGKHKELADLHHDFLDRVFDPLIPSTYQQLTVKYNIPSRLWQTGFHLILERLRHAWMSSQPAALDLLTDLVYYAYKFYTDLLEDAALLNFRTAWIEALGDLARYRMAIASHVVDTVKPSSSPPLARIDDDDEPIPSGASIGAEVAEAWDVEDKETWRTTARDWYTMGITEKPGEGRLHHHLALLCRDVRGDEGRALHHFSKSLIVTHEYETSRESILPLFDSALQSQRSLPEATAMDLFVRLHGMLFTRIQLDDFPSVMSRYMERLEEDASLDGVSRKATITQVDWMLMATANLAAVLQYGSGVGVIRKALAQEGQDRRRQQAVADDLNEEGDLDGEDGIEPLAPLAEEKDVPRPASEGVIITPTITNALELAFAVFNFTLAHPNRLQGIHSVLNPYITVLLTFLATLFRQPHVGAALMSAVPWQALVDFLNSANIEFHEETRLAAGPPLPEDWAVRGMEWVGRRVYERGFWKARGSGRASGMMAIPKTGERFQSEMDVLLASFDSAIDISEGVVEEADGTDLTDGPVAVNQRRWKRVAWAAGILAKHVDGLDIEGERMVIQGALAARLAELRDQNLAVVGQKRQPTAEESEEDAEELVDTDSEDDDPELVVLKERRHHLRSLLNIPVKKVPRSNRGAKKSLRVVPGYTMLIFDTNVLLSALSLFSKVVEGGQWSVVIPLPVVTELDGLSKNPPPLGAAAHAAVAYLEGRIRTHSLCLKIQTSKGNYLSDLLIRTEHLDFQAGGANPETVSRTMDDLILNIASFQAEHFVDRSQLLGLPGAGTTATKVLLVTFDRNLRLKARGRGIDAADEKEMAAILGKG